MSKKEENILDWLKEELALERIQVVIPPTDEQIKETIKELIKDPKMRNMLERVLIISTERKEYMKLLAFQLECSICNNNTTTILICLRVLVKMNFSDIFATNISPN